MFGKATSFLLRMVLTSRWRWSGNASNREQCHDRSFFRAVSQSRLHVPEKRRRLVAFPFVPREACALISHFSVPPSERASNTCLLLWPPNPVSMSQSYGIAAVLPALRNTAANRNLPAGVGPPGRILDNAGEVVSELSYGDESFPTENTSPKEKGASSTAKKFTGPKSGQRRSALGRRSATERQKVTRACDACKRYALLGTGGKDLW
jgi:hypothetical protein